VRFSRVVSMSSMPTDPTTIKSRLCCMRVSKK
jgi:hypothetical protein